MTTTFPRTMGYGLGGSLQRGTSAFGPWVTSDPFDYPLRDQTMTAAPAFPPFKFELRRARIDWRLLHGIDINAMMRDVDLDTLEKIVNIVAFGDIEAEDTRHLTELNFIKIFRLSQMMIEYLLYVQDCLQNSNTWLQQDRTNMDKYVQAARLRIRELEANIKMNKRELRRSRKTIKTYELLAVLNDGKGVSAATLAAAAAPASPPPPPQVMKPEPNPVSLAMEALLRKELAVLGERLSKATLECQTLRAERDELYQAVKDLETAVKARGALSGASSPLAYARQTAEAVQTIQGLQDQLNKATVEITKLRNEKGDLTEELERATTERRQLQDEKSRLLSELASRPGDSPRGVTDSPRASENLSSMLLEADRQKAALQDQLAEAKAEIAALQKQLVKAMKATALGTLPPSQPADDRLVRELEATRAQLERDLADARRNHDEDVRQMQEELDAAQAQAAEVERKLAELRAVQQRDNSGRVSPPRSGGFVKIMDEPRGGPAEEAPDASSDRLRGLLADYEATNERLNQQLIQLKGERNTLAGEVEQLRMQLQNRAPPSKGDRSIGRDWRTEEMERLKEERDAAQRRILDLEDALQDRDALMERLRTTIRDLQAQLEERDRQLAGPPAVEPSRVKQQVKHFEQLAEPAKPSKVQSSFSFRGDSPAGSGAASVETPTSLRRPATSSIPDDTPASQPPRPASLAPSPIPEEPEEPELEAAPVDDFALPSPQRPRQPQEPSQANLWLRRIPRPSPADAELIHQGLLRRVAGIGVQALDMLHDENCVITENPYEYIDGEEERFRSMMPHEVEERKGVRSVDPHRLEDLATARSLFTDQLLAVVGDELAQYGVDPDGSMLSDKAYVACMQELNDRRSRLLQRYPREVQERADDLRNFLLTHIELTKRSVQAQQQLQVQQELQQLVQQQKLAQQLTAPMSVASGSRPSDATENELEPDDSAAPSPSAVAPASAVVLAQQQQQPQSRTGGDEVTRSASLTPRQGLTAAAEAASKPLSAAAAAIRAPRPLPTFPSRQGSLQRSSIAEAEASTEGLRSMLPPAPGGFRPISETSQKLAASSRRSMAAEKGPSGAGAGSTHLSREPSEAHVRSGGSVDSRDGDSVEQQPTTLTSLMRRTSSGASSDRAPSPRQQSLPRSGTSTRSQTAAGTAAAAAATGPSGLQGPTPVMLKRQTSPGSPERITLGHTKPTVVGRSPAAAKAQGENMNMSIRPVKYQESDFDDDDDDPMPLPQPKPVRRVADDDEYALTEDEEAQQDMGIEESIEDFHPGSSKPRILMAAASSSPPKAAGPSRLGMQPTPATAQTRGWATDEPLQKAPVKQTSQQASTIDTAEVEDLDSIQTFDARNSQSSTKRSPGAWGSPSATMRKAAVQGGREPSTQVSHTASKLSGWNEAIRSFAASSGTADEVQPIQDITESFNDSIRPMGRFMGQRGPAAAAPQATVAQPRIIPRRSSFDSEVSDMEFA